MCEVPPLVHVLGFSIYLPRFTSQRISSTQHTQRDACSHGGRNLPSSSSDDPTPDEALGMLPRVNKKHADSHLNVDQAKLSNFSRGVWGRFKVARNPRII